MPRLIDKGDPGTDRSILIDGIQLSILPADLDAPPEPVSDYLDRLDGGASEHQRRPYFLGAPAYSDRYTFTFAYDQITGDDRVKMEEIRVAGGTHRIVVWRMVPIIWHVQAGVSRYYLGRFRKPAEWLYRGLILSGPAGSTEVTAEHFPIDATLAGEALTVTYAEGPTLADPGTGGVVIARQPDVSGEAADYTAVRVGGTLTTGDVLMLWGVWAHEVSLRAPGLVMRGQTETQSYTFVEV
jgi:hypothetical protein